MARLWRIESGLLSIFFFRCLSDPAAWSRNPRSAIHPRDAPAMNLQVHRYNARVRIRPLS
jgi:hypothetical protein